MTTRQAVPQPPGDCGISGCGAPWLIHLHGRAGGEADGNLCARACRHHAHEMWDWLATDRDIDPGPVVRFPQSGGPTYSAGGALVEPGPVGALPHLSLEVRW